MRRKSAESEHMMTPPIGGDQPPHGTALRQDTWHDRLDAHAGQYGFHAYLSEAHGALFTEEDTDLLLVTFENAQAIRSSQTALPNGLTYAGREGWSQLCLYGEGETWFRDPEVYAFFDDMVDEGFFDRFETVLFFGIGSGGYAAAAFSVVAPGARVLALRPQATLTPELAGWDTRFPWTRRMDFTSRYGFAPEMLDAADFAAIVYDPLVEADRIHAALFARPHVLRFRTPRLGPMLETNLEEMDLLAPLLRDAGRGRLTAARFAAHWRARRKHGPYLRNMLDALERSDRPSLAYRWCRAVLRNSSRARFQTGLTQAQETLEDRGLPIPTGMAAPTV